MKKSCVVGSFLLLIAVLAGCVHQPLIKHEEVLIYNKAYDFTYQEVLKALDNCYPWSLSHTDKGQGFIAAFNQKYWDTTDADKRTAVILVKRLSRKQTSVSLSPESQNVIGAADILKTIDQLIGGYKN